MVVAWAWESLTAIAFVQDRIPVQYVHLQHFNFPLHGIYYFVRIKPYYSLITLPISTMIKLNRRWSCFISSSLSRSIKGCGNMKCPLFGLSGTSWNCPPQKIWCGFQLVNLHHSRWSRCYNQNRQWICNISRPFERKICIRNGLLSSIDNSSSRDKPNVLLVSRNRLKVSPSLT